MHPILSERESSAWGSWHLYDLQSCQYRVNISRFENSILVKPGENEIQFCISYLSSDANIFHWCQDVLVRIILLKQFADCFSGKNVTIAIINSGLSAYQELTLQACLDHIKPWFHNVNVKYLPVGDYTFENCVHITPPNGPFFYKRSVHDLSTSLKVAFLGSSRSSSSFKGEKIFLVRNSARNLRQIVNMKQVSRTLAKSGFILVDPAHLSPRGQAEIFSDSRLVAGTHGAAFVNMLFGDQANICIEISPSSYRDVPTFYIAEVLGIDWTRFIAPTVCPQTHSHLLTWEIIEQLVTL